MESARRSGRKPKRRGDFEAFLEAEAAGKAPETAPDSPGGR